MSAPDTVRPSPPVPMPVAPMGEMRCFTIVVEGRPFGLPVEFIQTVFEMHALTAVPLAPQAVLGLVNLRGKIATAISLRRQIGPDPSAIEPSLLAVGIEYRGEAFALVVDEVGDVLTLDAGTEIEMPPHLGADSIKFSSVHRLEEKILPILDLDWVLHLEP